MTDILSTDRLSQWRYGHVIALCESCGRIGAHDVETLKKYMPRTTPVDALRSILTPYCPHGWKRDECQAELDVPGDDVAMEG